MNILEEKLFKISMKSISVDKDMTGNINGNEYKYASLTNIKKALTEELEKLGVSYRFSVSSETERGTTLTLTITDFSNTHTTSMFIPNVQMANENVFHTVGSGLTYYKKYMLATEFNLDVQNDIDANTKQIKRKLLLPNSKEFNTVVKLIKNGATKADIESKYIISEAIATELNQVIKNV